MTTEEPNDQQIDGALGGALSSAPGDDDQLSELTDLDAAVTSALRDLAPPEPIPPDVASQIFAALAHEPPLAPAVGVGDSAARTVDEQPSATEAATVHQFNQVHQIQRRREPRWRRPLFAVAGIAAAGLIAVTVGPTLLQTSSSSDSMAGGAAESAGDETASDADAEGSPGYAAEDSTGSPATDASDPDLSARQSAARLLSATAAGVDGELSTAVVPNCGQVLADELGRGLVGVTVLEGTGNGEKAAEFVVVTTDGALTFYSVVPTCASGSAAVTASGTLPASGDAE